MIDRITWIHQKATKGKILDIGSFNGSIFNKGVGWDVVFVDLDAYPIPKFVQADAELLPFNDNVFDMVTLLEVLEHVSNPIAVLKEAARVSKERILITVPEEHLWREEYLPMMEVEERLKVEGMTLEEAVNSSRAEAVRVCDENEHPHLSHVRYYDRDMLENQLKTVSDSFKIDLLLFKGWAHYCAEVWV